MADTSTATRTGALESALDELREGFRGDVIEPGSAQYDESRTVFNGMFERRPAAILRPAGTADVIRAIGLARQSGLPLAIRGGAHSVAGFSMCDGGIVIDMRGMKGIRVDPRERRARAQAGLNWSEFDRETQAFGLATTGGRVTTTGVAGFTLGSGSGWLDRKHGFAGDNLISADVVTADGEIVTATEDENSELLWGLRGGGGKFAGDLEQAERVLKPIRDLKPLVDLWQPMPYLMVQGLLDPANPYGRRNYWRAYNVGDIDESMVDLFVERAETIPSPFTGLIMLNMGGAVSNVGENDTALSGRDVPFSVHLNGQWEGDADDENIGWVRETTSAFGPHIIPGMALNFITEISDDDLADSYGDKLQRLRKLKSAYDPTNLFRLNQNIQPGA
jgi:hypothetical protein